MYGKLFSSMFTGSLHGHWQAIITFQQMIILADQDGVVEMTPSAISSTTSIPLDIIEAGISILEAPDINSRTPGEEGRRITRINPDRPWGWHITNYAHYRAIRTAADRREYHKQYWYKRKLNQTQPDSTSTQLNQPIVEAEVKAEAEVKKQNTMSGDARRTVAPQSDKNKIFRENAKELLNFLNEKTGRAYRLVDSNLKPIEAILKSGVSLEDMRTVTMKKIREWRNDPKMEQYMRPSTLYRRSKFEQYLGQVIIPEARHE